ncbi:MAG: single-stranded DNA-binding protein [Candidatus Coprovivens sp.]
MLNQVVLVGRLTDDVEVATKENGKKVTSLILAVQRTFKNIDGIYETDFIRCTLWNAVAASTSEHCHKGDIVGIKGRIQVNSYEDKDGTKKYSTEVIAEKVTFLSSNKKDE